MPRLVLIAAAAIPLLLAGCGASEERAGTAQTTTRTATTSATATNSACESNRGGTNPRSGGKPTGTMLLSTLTVAQEEPCAERVRFDFRPDRAETPGYRVEYRTAQDAQTEDASGNHIDVAGSAFLVVRLEPAATADLSGGQFKLTYKGERRVPSAGTSYVREVVKTGDFEGVLTWTIGLSEERPFTVVTSDSPPRLMVEIH